MLVRIGSRGSRLALTQAEQAGALLRRPGVEVAFVPITTAGDRDRTKPFGEIGERGVFVKEIEEALLAGRIDVAVHSAKDMTSTDTDGLAVAAYLERDDPRDALIGATAIAADMRIGTASARRRSQLLALEPSLRIESLRGNVETRLRKMRERGLDAIVLAACGLDRLGLDAEIGLRLEPEVMLPEAAQGALALQVRAGEEELAALADHAETRRRVELERRCVAAIGAGCLAPVGAHHDGSTLRALIADDGGAWVEHAAGDDPEAVAARLLAARSARLDRGMKVVVTRPRDQAAAAGRERLEVLGIDVVECPLIEIERTSDEPIDAAGYDWLIVTSPNGADELARRGTRPAARRGGRAGHGRGAARSTGSSRRSSRRSLAGRAAPRVSAAGGPRPLRSRRGCAAATRSTVSAPTSSRSTARGSSTPPPPDGDSCSWRRARPRAPTRRSAGSCRPSRSARRRRASRGGSG